MANISTTFLQLAKRGLLLLALIVAPSSYLSAQDTGEGELAIAVTGLRNTNGNIVLTYYNDIEDYYEKDKSYFRSDTISLMDLDKKSKTKIVKNTLPIGKYVIFVFHDEDKNGKMAKSLLGSNLEGGGYANHTKGPLYRRPQFKDVAITITEGCSAVTTVRLQYAESTF